MYLNCQLSGQLCDNYIRESIRQLIAHESTEWRNSTNFIYSVNNKISCCFLCRLEIDLLYCAFFCIFTGDLHNLGCWFHLPVSGFAGDLHGVGHTHWIVSLFVLSYKLVISLVSLCLNPRKLKTYCFCFKEIDYVFFLFDVPSVMFRGSLLLHNGSIYEKGLRSIY